MMAFKTKLSSETIKFAEERTRPRLIKASYNFSSRLYSAAFFAHEHVQAFSFKDQKSCALISFTVSVTFLSSVGFGVIR